MTREEAVDIFVAASCALREMGRYDDADFLHDGAAWLDPSFPLCTLDEIREQARKLRRFTFKHAGIEGRIGGGLVTIRARLFVVEVLRSIDA